MVYPQDSHSWKNENYNARDFKVDRLNLPAARGGRMLKNIRWIQVIDARPDSSAVGLLLKPGIHNHHFIALEKGTRQETEQFVNHYLGLSPTDTTARVLMVLKKLWLTDELDPLAKRSTENLTDSTGHWTSGIIARIEFYLEKQSKFYPLYRFDTISSRALTVMEAGTQYIEQALEYSLSRLYDADERLADIHARAVTWEEISKFNEQRYDIPILKDTVLRRGVYTSFDEFKNNLPSFADFSVKRERFTDIIYVKQADGKESAIRNVWGYCDGRDGYVQSAENFFRLQRLQNSFYVCGAKILTHKNRHAVGLASAPPGQSAPLTPETSVSPDGTDQNTGLITAQINSKRFRMIRKPFQLDWDDGKLY
jgi:hypothetical protein